MTAKIENQNPSFGSWVEDDDQHSIEYPERRASLSDEVFSEKLREKDLMEDKVLDRVANEAKKARLDREDREHEADPEEWEAYSFMHGQDEEPNYDFNDYVDGDQIANIDSGLLEKTRENDMGDFDGLPRFIGIRKQAHLDSSQEAFVHRKPENRFYRLKKMQVAKKKTNLEEPETE